MAAFSNKVIFDLKPEKQVDAGQAKICMVYGLGRANSKCGGPRAD